MEMNWDKINQYGDAAATSTNDKGERSVYLKLKPGNHPVRLLPMGNKQEDIPFKRIVQHSITYFDGTRKATKFCLCWNWIASDLENVARPLVGMQKLTPDDMKLYKQHGCPFCSAMHHMDKIGVAKEIKNQLYPKESFVWNVLYRADGQVYVWNTSKKIFNMIMNNVKMFMENKVNIFDLNAGYDMMITAEGEALQRRYNVIVMPIPKPIGVVDFVPYDLMETAAGSFKNYQMTIDILNEGMGKQLASIGYNIPGDKTMGVFENKAEKELAPTPSVTPANTEGRKELGDGMYEVKGVLYTKEGKPLF